LSLTRNYADWPCSRSKTLRATLILKTLFPLWFLLFAVPFALAQGTRTNLSSRLLSIEGKVEVARAGTAAWSAGNTNLLLANGDRVRTGVRSRATIQLSDRSVLRVNELTTLEIRPPQAAGASSGFELKSGASYFFNRERPGAVEFRTPMASGAIRGTEFHLAVAENGRTELALVDGLVDLSNEFGTNNLASGDQAVVEPGQPPRKTAMVDVASIIQWALYYPAIIDVEELGFADTEKSALTDSLVAYRAGDLLTAQSAYPDARQSGSDAEKVYRAATLLAVGQVKPASELIQNVSTPVAAALLQLIQVVKGQPASRGTNLTLASEWMAESYALQAQSKLPEALQAARRATEKSTNFGFAWARLAELEFSFGHADAAQRALDKALAISPRHAQAHALRGFALAARGKFSAAEAAFDEAVALDSALANGWLGRGLVRIRRGRATDGRQDLQVAATLEPQRSILRSYLGKAWSETRNVALAEKELRLAQKLDENDPTPWLYSAILAEQQNKVNEAIRDLEHSQDLNDNRSLYRSSLLLDQDKSIRSANLARIYQDAGMSDWAVREASRAVSYDYANFSAHQFLANSYEGLRDPKLINLRYEAPAESEYFIANLLSPVGATPLSATVSQQEYTRLFERNHVGVASSTEYFSNGDWIQQGVQYGHMGTTDWAFEAAYRSDNGQRFNNELERTDYLMKVRQQVTSKDTFYFEGQRSERESGDLIQYYNQNSANPTLRTKEVQNPNLFLGYHHEWSPGNHTLALVGNVDDIFHSSYGARTYEFNHDADRNLFSTRSRPFNTQYHSEIEGWVAELQQILTLGRHTVVFGGRAQEADSDARDRMALQGGEFPGSLVYPTRFHSSNGDIERQSAYVYDMWQILEPLHITAGLTYDHLSYPRNQELNPLSRGDSDQSRLSPKAGLIWNPVKDTTLRGAYTRSLGGVFFDNSLRLEPTAVASFNQSFRSLVPESVAGNIPGTRFETFGAGFDHKFGHGTYLTILGEALNSEATRTIGAFRRFADSVLAVSSSTPAEVGYKERSLSIALNQLVGDEWAFGARYRLTDADFNQRFKEVPLSFNSPGSVEQDLNASALLHQLRLYASYTHRCGFFSELISTWTGQDNRREQSGLRDDEFWQLDAFAGYRLWRRHAEARIGVLNITDQDYKLNPLTLYNELPRERTFYASFKFYF
jgi:Tfp pilus assembly protein PilF